MDSRVETIKKFKELLKLHEGFFYYDFENDKAWIEEGELYYTWEDRQYWYNVRFYNAEDIDKKIKELEFEIYLDKLKNDLKEKIKVEIETNKSISYTLYRLKEDGFNCKLEGKNKLKLLGVITCRN